jgi:opacity protein-like surface antigen
MKRFIVAAVAAAALAAPAGASADTQVALDADAVRMTCPTPVVSCVNDQVTYAFSLAQSGVNLAKAYANYVVWLASQPPNINAVCYAIYGRPCTTVL